MPDNLQIAEILYESGAVRFRYLRYLSPDGTRWIRHGLFRAYHETGPLASEGNYVDGVESGLWRDYHPNGQLAAEGSYVDGREVGEWHYWSENGSPENAADVDDQ
jgi:antitoxin component YwqK of YwqJK toxin-antitoxin module